MVAANGAAEIELVNVTKRFGSSVAVHDLSFTVGNGEIVALLGRTGAGKSTAMNLIMGTIGANSGTVRVAGFDPHRDFKSLRGKLAVSFQTDRLLPWRTSVQNIELGLQILGVEKHEGRRRATDWLARVKMAGSEDKYAHELSGGMRQRVSRAPLRSTPKSFCWMSSSASLITSRPRHCVPTFRNSCASLARRVS